MNNGNIFLMVLGAGKFEIKALIADSLSGEVMLTESSRGGRGKAAPWDPFYKVTHPIQEGSIFMD